MRDLTLFKDKIFPLDISSLMTVILDNKTSPAITENDDYYFINPSLRRTLKADNITVSRSQIQRLQQFYYEMQGSKHLFRVKDHFYNHADHAFIAFGDGAKTDFPILIDIGQYILNDVYAYDDGMVIYVDDIIQPDNSYILTGNHTLIFDTPPDVGSEIKASFHYDFIMRFTNIPIEIKPNINQESYKIYFKLK